LSAHTNLAVRA